MDLRRDKDTLVGYEVDILRAAFWADEGIYPYGLASQLYPDDRTKVTNGTMYRRFQVLEEAGMLDRCAPVAGDEAAPRIPYELTVLGVVALTEVEPWIDAITID